MKASVAKVVALAAALAGAPALGEEPTKGVSPAPDGAPVEVAGPPATLAPARQAVETLRRLRLHPGEDSLDLTETARRRPHPASE